MIQRFSARSGGRDGDTQVFFYLGLPDKLG
jgi:hypothetical protein